MWRGRGKRRRAFTIFLRLAPRSLCDVYRLGGSLRTSDPPGEAVIRNQRRSDGAPQPLPETEPSGELARVPNDAIADRPRMARWREVLFRILLRADARSDVPYGIPPEQFHHVDVLIER